jgi:16S rRNA U516 pseudouridylate synthase RsuA-like enzyme
MAKRKKREVDQDWRNTIHLLELQCGIIQHTAALKAVGQLLAEDKKAAAVARLDQATAGLLALVRGQAAGVKMKCPNCGSEQDVVQWVDSGLCSDCGGILKVPGDDVL